MILYRKIKDNSTIASQPTFDSEKSFFPDEDLYKSEASPEDFFGNPQTSFVNSALKSPAGGGVIGTKL